MYYGPSSINFKAITLLSNLVHMHNTPTQTPAERLFRDIIQGKPLTSIAQAAALIPANNIADTEAFVTITLAEASTLKQNILSIAPEARTYANTVAAYDKMMGIVSIARSITETVEAIGSDVEHRHEPNSRIQREYVTLDRRFLLDLSDTGLYRAFCEYRDNGMAHETLSNEQHYFFTEVLNEFRRAGCNKDTTTFIQVTDLIKKISETEITFSGNINKDTSLVTFEAEELTGVDTAFIAAQARDELGRVILYCNYPTTNAVLPHCSNPVVRKALATANGLRAYPHNVIPLQEMLSYKQRLAEMLGFKNAAAYELSPYMIKTPAAAHAFLHTLQAASQILAHADISMYLTTAPNDVVLIDGKLQSWDVSYVETTYKKLHFNIDQRIIAEYFPVNKTVTGIFAIYEKFMGVSFDYHATVEGAWDPSVSGITVYTKDRSQVLGYILLDLFPRPKKYSHACCAGILPRVGNSPASCIVIANFPQPQGDTPGLLLHSDVTTFFHEFGHAIHYVLGYTTHMQTSGYNVKLDFVELPSQILEAWMWDKEMLRLVSSHYKTGKPLSDEIIDNMIAAHKVGKGMFEADQTYKSLLSLYYYEAPTPVDLDGLQKKAYLNAISGIAPNPESKMYAAFGHLAGYGPGYYGYSLSRAYAYDVFARIKEYGLLNEEIGARFVEYILKPGGSKDPNELLHDFLGRPASSEAYIAWLATPQE